MDARCSRDAAHCRGRTPDAGRWSSATARHWVGLHEPSNAARFHVKRLIGRMVRRSLLCIRPPQSKAASPSPSWSSSGFTWNRRSRSRPHPSPLSWSARALDHYVWSQAALPPRGLSVRLARPAPVTGAVLTALTVPSAPLRPSVAPLFVAAVPLQYSLCPPLAPARPLRIPANHPAAQALPDSRHPAETRKDRSHPPRAAAWEGALMHL